MSSMAVPTSNKRAYILRQGLDVLTTTGFSGVTIGGLAEQTGMSKSGLFAHFGSKEELQLSLLNETDEAVKLVLAPAVQEPEGLPRLRALVHHWLGWSTKAGLKGGCPMVAGMFELDDQPGSVRERLLEMESQWRSFLAEVTAQAVERGHLRAELDIEGFVWELCGIYLSHHASARFIRDPNADERAKRAFAALIDRSS